MRYLFIDSNLLAAIYAPTTLDGGGPAAKRIGAIVGAVEAGSMPGLRLLTATLCVGEAFTVLSKRTFTGWRRKGNRREGDLNVGEYDRAYAALHSAIHHARVIESLDLNRYHVLCRHLVAPVDHNTQAVSREGKRRERALGGTDQLICGMGIWLARLFGRERFAIATADLRLAEVLRRASQIGEAEAEAWGVHVVAEHLQLYFDGRTWHPGIYPRVIDFVAASDDELRRFIGAWPTPEAGRAPAMPP